jgi:signal transduction histidine kinase
VTALCRQIVEEDNMAEKRDVPIRLAAESVANPVTIDPDLFHHIFRNLVSNAVKYSQPSSTVHINLRQEDSQLVLTISDQGIGIPKRFQSHLFESFRRADNVGNRPGTGLGLTIVKRAVDAHGGTVDFTSQENQGTTFTVTLPLGIDHGHAHAEMLAPEKQRLALNGQHAL